MRGGIGSRGFWSRGNGVVTGVCSKEPGGAVRRGRGETGDVAFRLNLKREIRDEDKDDEHSYTIQIGVENLVDWFNNVPDDDVSIPPMDYKIVRYY